MPKAKPGDVWIVDLGLAAKTRPCLLPYRVAAADLRQLLGAGST
jgi:hypothetical protein